MTNNILSEVYEEVYDLMGERTTSTTYNILSAVSLINRYIEKICSWFVVSLLNKEDKYIAWNLKFLERIIYCKNISPTSITVETTNWCSEITINTSSYPNSGSFVINGEIWTYTSKSPTQLLWVTGITTNHIVWSTLYLIFALPSTVSKPFQVYDINGYEIEAQDFRFNEKTTSYTVITDDNNIDYIRFNNCPLGNTLVRYYKTPSKLTFSTDDNTEIDIPWSYGLTMIAPLVAWHMKYTQWEEIDLATANLTAWYAALEEFYAINAEKTKAPRKSINMTYPRDNTFYRGNCSRNV